MYQATQIESDREKRSQMSFMEHALFQEIRSRQPRPPSSFARVIVSHAIRAERLPSEVPCQRKALQREFIFFMQALGRTKVELQKLVIPATTVFKRRRRPGKERDLALHEVTFPLYVAAVGHSCARRDFAHREGHLNISPEECHEQVPC